MSLTTIVQNIKLINSLVCDGALKNIAGRKILEPASFEFSALPDSYQDQIIVAVEQIREESELTLFTDEGLILTQARNALQKEGIKLERHDFGTGNKEVVVCASKFDLVVS